MICERHFLQNTYLVLQNADHAANIVDGVAIETRFDDEHEMNVDDGLHGWKLGGSV
jgi:hypothetical protein